MRVLILNPPFHLPIIREGRCQSPQGMRKNSIPQMTLAYLAAVLGKAGHSLRVYDCIALGLSMEEVMDEITSFGPQLALINTTTPSIDADLAFVRSLKERLSDCFTALFGTHVTALHKEILSTYPYVDCIIRHEPEWTAFDLASAMEQNRILNGIPGCTLRVNGRIIFQDRDFNADLDGLPFPAWENLPLSIYIHPVFNKPYVLLNTSRGCSHNCIFCVAHIFYGKKVRFRSISSLIDELEHYIIGRFGIRHVWFYADDFTHSPEFVKELCQAIIESGIKITWWSNTRVDKPDREMYRLMKQAGCYMLSIGGESGNLDILKKMKKGTKPEYIKRTVHLLRELGINSLVYFLIGLPGENRYTIQETIRFAKEINPDYVEFYPATPYPGTEFYETAVKDDQIVHNAWDKYFCGGEEFVTRIPGLEKEELDKILRRAYRDFYFRVPYVLRLLRRMLHPAEFVRMMAFGLGYLRRFQS